MEQHAVPQDITGFKFKLVGDMTLKQFGELAGGAVIAYIFYATPWPAIIRWPFVIFFGFFGFALAFLPIEERPLDVWIGNFFKAIYHPTLYIWRKGAIRPTVPITNIDVTTAMKNPMLAPQAPQPEPQLWPYPKDEKKVEEEKNEPEKPVEIPVVPVQETAPVSPPTEIVPPQPISIEDLQKIRDDTIKAKYDAVIKAKPQPSPPPPAGPPVITVEELAKLRDNQKILEEQKMKALTEEKKNLADQIDKMQTKIQALSGSDTSQIQTQLQDLQKQQTDLDEKLEKPSVSTNDVKVVDRPLTRQTVISLTELPNVVNGIVTNNTGTPLDGTILLVKDKSGNAIRALKSNQIGQFIASTPLPNGTYYLEFERQGYTFDVLEIVMDGKVIQPLEIHAKN